jgi:hypothetical protein
MCTASLRIGVDPTYEFAIKELRLGSPVRDGECSKALSHYTFFVYKSVTIVWHACESPLLVKIPDRFRLGKFFRHFFASVGRDHKLE